MTVEKIIEELCFLAERLRPGILSDWVVVLHQAVALLKTHPEAQPNVPLTLEELREMDGKPVYIVNINGHQSFERAWALVFLEYGLCRTANGSAVFFGGYEKEWVAYRRPPHEAEEAKEATP